MFRKESRRSKDAIDGQNRLLSSPPPPSTSLGHLSLCIWGDGPGKPFDNVYTLIKEEIDEDNDTIKLFFGDNEECIIEKPSEVARDDRHFDVSKAKKITWKFYYYGKPQTPETLTVIEYTSLSDSNVRVTTKSNYWPRDEIIGVSGKPAFASFGELKTTE